MRVRWSKLNGDRHQSATWGGALSTVIPHAEDNALVTNNVDVIADNGKELTNLSVGKVGVAGSATWSSGGRLDPAGAVKVGDGGTLTLDGGTFLASTVVYAGYTKAGGIVVNSGAALNTANNLLVARGYSGNYAGANGSSLVIAGGS